MALSLLRNVRALFTSEGDGLKVLSSKKDTRGIGVAVSAENITFKPKTFFIGRTSDHKIQPR